MIAGTAGSGGYTGDGGPATSAQLNLVTDVFDMGNGNLGVVDSDNLAVRMISPVIGVSAPAVTVTPASFTVQAFAGNANPPTQAITLRAPVGALPNGPNGTYVVAWNVTANTASGGNWLSVSPEGGTSAVPVVIQVAFNVGGLPPGIYTGSILVNPGAIAVPVRLLVSSAAPVLLVGETGLLFTGAQGATLASQPVSVANSGIGTMNWTASVVNGSWLSLSSTSGSSTAGASVSSTLGVQAASTGLPQGTYYGLIQVSASGAANSPQYIGVTLNVLAASASTPVRSYPQGLIFIGAVGGTISPQTVSLSTGDAGAVTVTSSVSSTGTWLSASPSSLSLSPSGSLTVNASTASMAAGVYSGTVTLTPSDGSSGQQINAYLILTSGSETHTQSVQPLATSCSPTKLVMVLRQLGSNFNSATGWPVALEAEVVDNCGNPALAATVIATFSNGDPPLALASLGNGIYSATWKPGSAAATTVTVLATEFPLPPATIQVNGQIGANSSPPPAIGSGGVVNGASFAPGAEVAPGSIVSVFGSNLANSDGNLAPGLPLPKTLANIKLTIGGLDAPLFYAGKGQVNAQIPFELSSTQTQVVPRAIPATGAELDGVPEPIVVGTAHPGIFTTTGTQGAILNVSNQLVDSGNPATALDVIVIFCTGLGAVNPPAQTGQTATSGVAVLQPTVTIGGAMAVLQYAGVAPGYVGLYQVNAVVPSGLTTGPAVAVVITQNGVASNAATIAVK